MVLSAARAGATEGFCCLANEQTAGRGRQGREWVAPAGTSLLASVLLRRSPRVAAGMPLVAGLAVIDVLATGWHVAARLKWPNDVLVDGRKLAGILSEVAPGASGGSVAIALGIGLNLSVGRFPDGVSGVSLHTLVDEAQDAETLLLGWGDALRTRIAQVEAGGLAAIVDDWRRHATGLGMAVTITTPAGTFEGVAIDIADDGGLLVESGGVVRHVLAGDVHLSRSPTG